MTTGERIKARRLEAGLSQEGLARAADVSLRTITRLEQDLHDARVGTMSSIAAALGASLSDLVSEPSEAAS